jgi:hypothetical protein
VINRSCFTFVVVLLFSGKSAPRPVQSPALLPLLPSIVVIRPKMESYTAERNEEDCDGKNKPDLHIDTGESLS